MHSNAESLSHNVEMPPEMIKAIEKAHAISNDDLYTQQEQIALIRRIFLSVDRVLNKPKERDWCKVFEDDIDADEAIDDAPNPKTARKILRRLKRDFIRDKKNYGQLSEHTPQSLSTVILTDTGAPTQIKYINKNLEYMDAKGIIKWVKPRTRKDDHKIFHNIYYRIKSC